MFAICACLRGRENLVNNQKNAKKIDQVLMSLNKKYHLDLYESFKRTSNTSFEAVLHKAIYVFEIIDKLKYSLDDLVLDFGVGFCESMGYSDPLAIVENGKLNAFHALDQLNCDNDYGNSHIQISLGKPSSLEKMVNSTVGLSDFVESRWRQSQHDLMKYLVLHYGYMENIIQKDVALDLGISAQNLNQQLKNSGYFNILKLKRDMTVVLEQYRKSQTRSN